MSRRRLSCAIALLGAVAALAGPPSRAADAPPLSPEERRAILRHGPWPPPPARDPGNPLSHRPAAIALGQQLFFDPRLSPSGQVACASCHVPGLAFADGRARSQGLQPLDRHAPSLWNAVHHRWQGWDGAADSLWSQAIRPLLDPREMGADPAHLRARLRDDTELACRYRRALGVAPGDRSDEALIVDLARALGAYTATLVSPRTPFDAFRDALARGEPTATKRLSPAALRGLRLFVGEGRCTLCHVGPLFSNGEFADIGLPFFTRPGVVDPGRLGGIEAVLGSPYNRLSRWAEGADATPTRHLHAQMRHFGEFKVPSLREVARSAPYMHDGQLATLHEVLRHYAELNEERLHADGERILRPLGWNMAQREDMVAFLQTLSTARPPPPPRPLTRCR